MDGIGWSDSMWQYFNIDIARNLKKGPFEDEKGHISEWINSSKAVRCCEHIFFGGLKIDPAKAAACVASVAKVKKGTQPSGWGSIPN